MEEGKQLNCEGVDGDFSKTWGGEKKWNYGGLWSWEEYLNKCFLCKKETNLLSPYKYVVFSPKSINRNQGEVVRKTLDKSLFMWHCFYPISPKARPKMTLSLISAVPKCHYTLMVKELFRILHLNLLSNLSFLPAGVGVADGVRAKGRGKYEVRHDTWKAAVNNDSSILKRYEGNP